MYAYVICRLDIGFTICLATRFCDAPHEEHFLALKRATKYLRATKHWGIMFRRPTPMNDMPNVPFTWIEEDPNLPEHPKHARRELVGYVDASHATDHKTRRSVTGMFIMYGGAAIAWKSRLQSLVATSSTEAEFYAAVFAAKMTLYFRYILQELDALSEGPTTLYIDNQAALNMINENRPTERARHIAVQWFAIQQWRAQGLIIMRHLPGTINSSDAMTKALTSTLLYRHCRRAMGHYFSAFNKDDSKPRIVHGNSRSIEAGEGVGAEEVRDPSSVPSERGVVDAERFKLKDPDVDSIPGKVGSEVSLRRS